MKAWDRARGRWVGILSALGHEDALSLKHAPCPHCGGKDRYRYIGDEEGGFFCGDLRGSGIQLIQHLRGVDFKGAADLVDSIIGRNPDVEPQDNSAMTANALLTRRAVRPERSAYLASRGLEVPPGILFAKDVPFYEEGQPTRNFDAMLAPITRNGELLSYQATYLLKGAKAPVTPNRKTLPGKPISGGTVALYPAAECMGVAEGVETAIAAKMLFNTPTHATLSTSGMATWEPPAIAKEVWIFADHDSHYAGHAAAYKLAHRLVQQYKIAAHVEFPGIKGDWNDVLIASALKASA